MHIDFDYELEFCSCDELTDQTIFIEAEIESEPIEFDAFNSRGVLETVNKGDLQYICTDFKAFDETGRPLRLSMVNSVLIRKAAEERAREREL